MIYIFHGDDTSKSRDAYLTLIGKDVLKLDSKNIDLNQINNYLNEGSLFGESKAVSISNYFTIPKANLDKLNNLLLRTKIDIYIWQDKLLNSAQLKTFPQVKIQVFKADNNLYKCLNSIKPKNLNHFSKMYEIVINQNLFDLFLYLLKGKFRKLLIDPNGFNQKQILRTYLQLIELEFQYKTGQLALPREIALKRVLISLLK
jgi:hypothetical protein